MITNTDSYKRLLEIIYPIIQAPMAGGSTTPELVSAVSNAGGLGSFAAGYLSPEEIHNNIRQIRKLTHKPFGVNLFIPEKFTATAEEIKKAYAEIRLACLELNIPNESPLPPYAQSFEKQIQVILDEKVPVFSFTFGTLDLRWIEALKKNKIIVIGTATSSEEAKQLEENGVDMIVAQSASAGGHRGTFIGKAEDSLFSLDELIPAIQKQVKIPIIAAGGIMNSADLRNALDLGAGCVQIGTAFLTCLESGISEAYKKVLLNQKTDSTVLTRVFSGKFARGIRNKFIDNMQNKLILDYPIQNALTTPMRKIAKEKNNTEYMSLWAGQRVSQCKNLSAQALINFFMSQN